MKKLGREHLIVHWIGQWHETHRTVVFDILVSAAFTDAQFLTCLLDPLIEAFHHVLPAGRSDPYWAVPGENVHGKLLTGVRKAMITVASQLCYYFYHPYIVRDLNQIYLRRNVAIDLIPSVDGKVHLLHYPPPQLAEVVTPPAKHSRYFQEQPVCTDVRL